MSYTTLRIILLFGFTAAVACVPTSILAKNSELNNNQNLKVKRSSNADGINNQNRELSLNTLPPLNDFNYKKQNSDSKINSISTELIKTGKNSAEKNNLLQRGNTDADLTGDGNDTPTMLLHKRGINSELMYGSGDAGYGGRSSRVGNVDNNADTYNIAVPNGIWMDDEIDPALVYSDLPDLDDYPRGQYRSKAYDNLQNLLSSEAYLEPIGFRRYGNNRYYGPDNRRKRSNHNNPLSKYEMRLKRESKLTPADMLALVALVEAGERSRNEASNDDNDNGGSVLDPYTFAEQYRNQKMFYPEIGYQNKEAKNEYNSAGDNDRVPNAWLEPAVLEYYGMPYNLEMLPKNDVAREQNKYGQNRYSAKRFMISKKKRSLGRYLNEPIQKSPVAKSFKPSIVQKYF